MNRAKLWLPAVLAAAALTASACGVNPGADSSDPEMSEMSGMQGREETSVAEETTGMSGTEMSGTDMSGMDMGSMLMDEDGNYSDELFIDEMVPHHRAAIEEAEVALENTERPELAELSENIVASQEAEIEALISIKETEFGSSDVPAGMSEDEMEMMGMSMTPEELAEARPFDRAFLENMIPHHQSAIDMAQVALDDSKNEDIRRIADEIVESQKAEIKKMQQWQQEWYPNS